VLIGGVRLTKREQREGDQLGRHKPKREMNFRRGAIGTRPRWANEGGYGLRGRLCRREQSWASQARPRREFKWKFDFEFQMNLKFGWTLRNFTNRLEGIWTLGFFLNYFRVLKDF
jgi:hypothetical protein